MCTGSTRRGAVRALAVSLVAGLLCRPLSAREDEKPASDKESKGSDDPVYEPGGDVKPPKLVHYVEPAFSTSSKEAFVEGTVKISTVVALDGKPSECKVIKGLNAEEDRTAMEAVEQWRFEPGTKAGKPVRVRVNVEVDFHLM